MFLRLLGVVGCCLAVPAAAAAQGIGSPSATSQGGVLPDWPAKGTPGQKRQYRDRNGRTVIEYYDHQGTKRTIRDSGQNG